MFLRLSVNADSRFGRPIPFRFSDPAAILGHEGAALSLTSGRA
ncbi:MAG: hypothetical protein QOD29_837 [Alphaproteobacteria bacterium]|nr:hypothetical protein [Alphaproteobacteria bacterium]